MDVRKLHVLADLSDVRAQLGALTAYGFGGEALQALHMLAELITDLGLRDIRRLGLLNSRNHARLVLHGRHKAVLKLTCVMIGDEVSTLRVWEQAGLAGELTPRVYAYGHDHGRGWQWSLQQHLPGRGYELVRGEPVLAGALRTAIRLSSIEAEVPLPALIPVLDRKLQRAASSLAGTEDLVSELRETLGSLGTSQGVLHGDFAANNLLGGGRSLRVVDPAGLYGPRSYDVASFLARSTSCRPVAPRVAPLARSCRYVLEEFAPLVAAELLDMARWAVKDDRTGRGSAALVEDARRTLAFVV